MRPPSPVHTASAKTRRAQRRDSWRAILRASFERCGESVERWADEAGVGRSCAYRTLSRDGGDEMQLADLETLPTGVRRDVAEALAASLGCTLANRPAADAGSHSDVLLLASNVSASSDVVRTYAEAIADGSITAAEAATIEPQITAAMQALGSLRARMAQAQKERAIGVRIGIVNGGKR